MNAIEIRGLKKSFRGMYALNGLDMTVPVGSIYGFIGENGSGKSTTEKLICGHLVSNGGTINYNTANNGGAVYISDGTVNIGEGTIEYNKATNGDGGAIYISNASGNIFLTFLAPLTSISQKTLIPSSNFSNTLSLA